MTTSLEVLKRIIRDGVGLNRDTLNEMVEEIETLRAKVKDQGYAIEASGDSRFVK